MQNFLIFLTIFTIIFFGIDQLQKFLNNKSKWSRKATHILSGIVVMFFPEYVSSNEIYALTIFFLFFLGLSFHLTNGLRHLKNERLANLLVVGLTIFILSSYFNLIPW